MRIPRTDLSFYSHVGIKRPRKHKAKRGEGKAAKVQKNVKHRGTAIREDLDGFIGGGHEKADRTAQGDLPCTKATKEVGLYAKAE